MHPNGHRPLVSVITPTWNRPRTIVQQCIPSVWAQTYRPIQHIIVIDGVKPELSRVLRRAGYGASSTRRLIRLGRNWTDFSGNFSIGAAARAVGGYMAAGEYIAYLDDDDQYLPHYIESCVAELEAGADLTCTRWLHGPDRVVTGAASDGNPPPHVGTVSGSMIAHRTSLLCTDTWRMDGYTGDGLLVERWIAAGHKVAVIDKPGVIFPGWAKGQPDEEEARL